jgi:hypothetical protein
MVEPERDSSIDLSLTQPSNESTPWLVWAVAAVAILLGVGALILFGGHRATPLGTGPGLAPADPYAASLTIGGLKMSEASNFAGSKVTYLDGQITNQGKQTLTAITVQVAFRNDLKEIAQKETLPLSLIRTHEPYVDTQPVSASPLKPGEQREFRLIFDSVAADWNQQFPEVRVIQVSAQTSGQ